MSSYTKLFASILDSTVWQASDATRLVWITMLAMKDRDGIVEASIPGLAARSRQSIPATEQALEVLSSPDPYSRTKEHDGRRISAVDGGWIVLNHDKYADRSSLEEYKAKNAARQQRLRDRKAARNVTDVTDNAESRKVWPSDIASDPDLDLEKAKTRAPASAGPAFDLEAIYARFPGREGKTRGMASLKRQIKTDAAYSELALAVENYRSSKAVAGGFVKHFSTWAGCWRDYLEPEHDPVEPERTYNGRG
jgi:hypothetical protein